MPHQERPDEALARQIVGASLHAEVTVYDDNSKPSMVDALISYPDGRRGALEVVGDHAGQFYGLRNKLSEINHEQVVPGLRLGWIVVLRHDVMFRDMLRALPDALANLESVGVADIRNARRGGQRRAARAAADLGIWMAYSVPSVPVGLVRLQAEGWSGISGSMSLSAWVDEVLSKNPDVGEKLAKHPDVDERHAFIWSSIGSAYAIQSVLENRAGSTDVGLGSPSPPAGISHIWVAGLMSSQGALMWRGGSGWWRSPWNNPSGVTHGAPPQSTA